MPVPLMAKIPSAEAVERRTAVVAMKAAGNCILSFERSFVLVLVVWMYLNG